MMQRSWTTPSPRLRRLAARLALLVACIGVVATSPPSSPQVFAEQEGPPSRLTTTNPVAVGHLRLEIFEKKSSPSHVANLRLTTHVTLRWSPADPTQTVKPWLRARLALGPDRLGADEWVVLGEPGQPVELQARLDAFNECALSQVCARDVFLELELQSNAVKGTADVEWKMTAAVDVEGTDEVPEGFTVRFVEP